MSKSDALPECSQKVARDLIELRLHAINGKRDVLVETIIKSGVNDVVSGRETETCVGLQQREVLQMRIAIADQHIYDDAPE